MRKNSPRKWLHATLDLLPVILIPVFMVYSHRHDVTENVEVTYKYQSNEVNSVDDLVEGNIYEMSYLNLQSEPSSLAYYDINIYHFDSFFSSPTYVVDEIDDIAFMSEDSSYLNVIFNENGIIAYFFTDSGYAGLTFSNFDIEFTNVILSFNEFDENWSFYGLPQYTDYNVIESVDTTNTNVMDSFMNNFNNTIDKHFNMGNVFNLTGVYDWFNTNIFNGNAPQVIYSVWNIALYELVMDLLFLLYGLFMWFIDMVEHIMDKPFKSIK